MESTIVLTVMSMHRKVLGENTLRHELFETSSGFTPFLRAFGLCSHTSHEDLWPNYKQRNTCHIPFGSVVL